MKTRNLKELDEWKVESLRDIILESTSDSETIILDGEILLFDTVKKVPLPFTAFNKHKKKDFGDASICNFYFLKIILIFILLFYFLFLFLFFIFIFYFLFLFF